MGKPAISRPAPAVGYADGPEEFLWDGLALVRRGDKGYLCEPHANGGSPILDSDGGVLFNDLLGSTLGTFGGDGYRPVSLTAFGDTDDQSAFFTGKPFVDGLGYAFLLRDYRPDHGKWLTADPLGYPDGWNNLAYCNNHSVVSVDYCGGSLWSWERETLLALSYGVLYIVNAMDPPLSLVKYYFGPGGFPEALASLYSESTIRYLTNVRSKVTDFVLSAFSGFNNKSAIGIFGLPAQSSLIRNDSNTAWGAIIGTSTFTINGSAHVTTASDGGRNVDLSLNCRFFDDIDWKSYEELVVDHGGLDVTEWGITTDYVEGALDVWLDTGLQARYNVDVQWTEHFHRHYKE